MPRKEKYFTEENLQDEVKDIRDDILIRAVKEPEFHLKGNPALLVTDMQEYFLSPESHAYIPSAQAILPNITRLINIFNQTQHPIILTQHINDTDNAGNMKTWWKALLTGDSPYSKLYPLYHASTFPPVIQKTQYDAFHETELEKFLKENNIKTLIICGVMTNLCCETTLRSAFVKGYNAIIPLDATAAYLRKYHISTFVNLSFGFCPARTTSEILAVLEE
jgi:nicotinamidase-related amidase